MSEQPKRKPIAVKTKNVPEKRWHCDFCPATTKPIKRRDQHKCPRSEMPTFTRCTGLGCGICAVKMEATGGKSENMNCC